MVEQKTGSPLLTILVPTRNRIKYVQDLLASLEIHLNENQKSQVEVIVSDNSDLNSRPPKDLSESYKSLNLRNIHPPKLLLTAEENLFFCWQFATGKYVWILGDDDPINFLQITNLFDLLSKAEFPAYFWNSNSF